MSAALTLCSLIFFTLAGRSQDITSNEFHLPDTLKEISGLEKLNDSTLIAINDGGNPADLYLLNLKGEITRTIHVKNVENNDWEDLASDGESLFIADIGNNKNCRKNLCIYKVPLSDLVKANEVSAEKISIRYADQDSFPPRKNLRNYDAEAIAYRDGNLLLFTKNRTKPFNGICKIYEVPVSPGEYTISSSDQIVIGTTGWIEDAITGADVFGGQYILITYNRILIYEKTGSRWILKNTIKHKPLTQTEAILFYSPGIICYADEKHSVLGGGKLYIRTL